MDEISEAEINSAKAAISKLTYEQVNKFLNYIEGELPKDSESLSDLAKLRAIVDSGVKYAEETGLIDSQVKRAVEALTGEGNLGDLTDNQKAKMKKFERGYKKDDDGNVIDNTQEYVGQFIKDEENKAKSKAINYDAKASILNIAEAVYGKQEVTALIQSELQFVTDKILAGLESLKLQEVEKAIKLGVDPKLIVEKAISIYKAVTDTDTDRKEAAAIIVVKAMQTAHRDNRGWQEELTVDTELVDFERYLVDEGVLNTARIMVAAGIDLTVDPIAAEYYEYSEDTQRHEEDELEDDLKTLYGDGNDSDVAEYEEAEADENEITFAEDDENNALDEITVAEVDEYNEGKDIFNQLEAIAQKAKKQDSAEAQAVKEQEILECSSPNEYQEYVKSVVKRSQSAPIEHTQNEGSSAFKIKKNNSDVRSESIRGKSGNAAQAVKNITKNITSRKPKDKKGSPTPRG